MSYTIRQDAGHGIVEITYTDTITAESLNAATAEAIAAQKRTGALNFLVSAVGGLTAPLVDVYDLPEKTYREEDLDRRSRIALILPSAESAKQGVLFFQDACRNRGWNAKVFGDRPAAIEWLSKR